jgi:hypothetical protein
VVLLLYAVRIVPMAPRIASVAQWRRPLTLNPNDRQERPPRETPHDQQEERRTDGT